MAGRLHAAKDEDLMLAAHAAVGDAELKVAEIRVKFARKRALTSPQMRPTPGPRLGKSWVRSRPCSLQSRRCSAPAKRGQPSPGRPKGITGNCSTIAWPPKTCSSAHRTTCCSWMRALRGARLTSS